MCGSYRVRTSDFSKSTPQKAVISIRGVPLPPQRRNPAFRFCLFFCLSSCRDLLWPLPLPVLLRPITNPWVPHLTPPHRPRVGNDTLPIVFFSAVSAHLRALRVRPRLSPPTIPSVYAPIPTLQTIFHAFIQQNRMSSPPNPPKSRNPSNLNKIKVSQKRFLVMVNPVE
jgi:hypothetical protein